MARRTGDDRLLTVPNVITAVRLACFPLFLWLLFARDDRARAAYLMAVMGTTDFFDGWIARRFDQGSTLGKVLDPVADRLLLGGGVAALLIDGSAPRWVCVALVARELVVSATTLGLAALGARRIDVLWVGKAATLLCMLSFPLFLVSHADVGWADQARVLAWLCALPGLALSYYAAFQYVPAAREALAAGRAARAPQGAR